MANRLPWFPLYVDDYLNDTYDLSPCEHGVYLLLLSRFWISGPLRDDLDVLCRMAAGAQPQMVREILERFWELTGQGWVNARMQAEMAKSQARSARATAANVVRWDGKRKKPTKTTGGQIQMESGTSSLIRPTEESRAEPKNGHESPPGKNSTKSTELGIQMESNPHPQSHPQSHDDPAGSSFGFAEESPSGDLSSASAPRAKSATMVDRAGAVLERLNSLVSGANFKTVNNTGRPTNSAKLVMARMKEHGFDACMAVVETKAAEWTKKPDMTQYLRPDTLFRPTKFEQYLGQVGLNSPQREWGDFMDLLHPGQDAAIDGDYEVVR